MEEGGETGERERWRERWKGIGSKVERRGRESGGKNQ